MEHPSSWLHREEEKAPQDSRTLARVPKEPSNGGESHKGQIRAAAPPERSLSTVWDQWEGRTA